MARVLEGFCSFTCIPTRLSAIGMSHTCLCLLSYNWYTHLPTTEGWKAEYRPWCEVAQAEIRTCNLPIANPALYHTATSAPSSDLEVSQGHHENIVTFHISRNCAIVTLSLKRAVFLIFDFKNAVTLKLGSKVT